MAENARVRAARIRLALAEQGLTFSDIDRRNPSFYPGQARNAAYDPNEAGEVAISRALGVTPQELWPERFDPTGVRLVPQPRANYRPRPSKAASPKSGDALAKAAGART